MFKALRIILPLMVLVGAGFLGNLMIKYGKKPEGEKVAKVAPVVETVSVSSGDYQFKVVTQGEVAPRTEIDLVPEVSGRIVDVSESLAEGGFFEKGDVLIELDTADYELEVVRTESQLEQAKVKLVREEAEASAAAAEWKRLGKGLPSELLLRVPQIREAKAMIASAEAAVQKARRDLERCEIKAPFAGRVTRKSVDVGQFVSRGISMGRLYSVDVAEIRLPVSSLELGLLDLPFDYKGEGRTGEMTKVLIRAEIGGVSHEWEGVIDRTDGRVDARTRMFHAVARIEDPYARAEASDRPPLSVGLFVEATILGKTVKNAVVIPRIALRENRFVWVVKQNEKTVLELRDVTILQKGRSEIVVSEGISSGEMICLSTLGVMTEGMEVRLASDPEVVAEAKRRQQTAMTKTEAEGE